MLPKAPVEARGAMTGVGVATMKTVIVKHTIVALILSFLLCGSIYLVFPSQHYDTGSSATYIKYLLLFPLLASAITYYQRHPIPVPVLLFLTGWGLALSLALAWGTPPLKLALYGIPALALLAPSPIRFIVPKLMATVLMATAIGAAFEYTIVGGFARFADMGYRASSIFLNPNNLAVTTVILCAYVISASDRSLQYSTLALGAIIILASSSKTGMGLLGILFVYMVWREWPRVALIAAGCLVLAASGAVAAGLVRAPWLSVYFRILQSSEFVFGMTNPVFPSIAGVRAYVDNVYLQIWNEVGAPALLVYISALLYSAHRDRLNSPLWIIFGAAGVTENIVYLWPTGYLLWFYVANPPTHEIIVEKPWNTLKATSLQTSLSSESQN